MNEKDVTGHKVTRNHGSCITGIPYVDNCVKERAYKQAESACGNSLFHYRNHTEQSFSNSQIKAFTFCIFRNKHLNSNTIPFLIALFLTMSPTTPYRTSPLSRSPQPEGFRCRRKQNSIQHTGRITNIYFL